jgi:hypothetical protein
VIYAQAALAHHLLEVSVRELVAAVPSDTQEDERRLKVTPLERGFVMFQQYNSRRVMAELEGGL